MLESYDEICPPRKSLTAVFYELKRKFEEGYFARNTKSLKKNFWEPMRKNRRISVKLVRQWQNCVLCVRRKNLK